MKKIITSLTALLVIPSALADYGYMMDYGMMGQGSGLYSLYGAIWFALASFIFSLIFWLTYKAITKEKTALKHRRQTR